MERSGSSLPARRAARRRRKPTCCRSNSSKRLSATLASIGGDLSQQCRPQKKPPALKGAWAGAAKSGGEEAAAGERGCADVKGAHAPQHVIALDNVVTQRGNDM